MRLSVFGTLGEALRLYRAHWKLLVPLAVAVLLPQALLESALGDIEIDRVASAADLLKLSAIPLTVVISLAGEALLAGVITGVVLQWRVGRRFPGPRAFARSLPLLSLILVDLLLAIGATIGLLLLIVPGLVFITYFSIAPAVIEIERRGVGNALRRSATLVRSHFRQVFVLLIGMYVITEGIAQALLLLFHGFVPELLSEIGVDAMLESIQGLVIAVTAITLMRGRPAGEAEERPV